MEQSVSSYTVYFNKYYKMVYYYCNRMLKGDEDMAKDIISSVFAKLWDNMHRLEPDREGIKTSNVKAFLYICAKNELYNVFQTRKRRRTVNVEILPEEYHPLDEDMPDFDIINVEVIKFIHASIPTLPPQRGKVMKLLFQGFNSTEIANKCNCTRKTVLNQKLTAIAELKKLIKLKFDI